MLTEKDDIQQPPCTTQLISAWSCQPQLFGRKSTEATYSCNKQPITSAEMLPNQGWAPRYVRQLELLLLLSSKVANVPNHLGTPITKERTGALREGWTDATLYESPL